MNNHRKGINNRFNLQICYDLKFRTLTKQYLNIQKFWGETENAVRIQIYAAITAYCMVAIVQHDIGTKLSIFEVLETVSLVLAERIPLTDLLCNTNFKNVNELTGFCEPTLFDC